MKLVSKILMLVLIATIISCQKNKESKVFKESDIAIIPKPAELKLEEGSFQFNNKTQFIISDESQKIITSILTDKFKNVAGWTLEVSEKVPQNNFIEFKLDQNLEEEAYKLEVNSDNVKISSKGNAGFLYGIETLRQLLPVSIESAGLVSNGTWEIPNLTITDQPRYKYRGLMLDVSRHFFEIDYLKKTIDRLAMLKMNVLHLHLVDDQGWRIEIKKYPKLQEIAAYREETLIGHYNDNPQRFDGKRYGGFYTQEEVKEVVAYAKKRFVTVIPEIEMPGHSVAALSAYPELGCTPGPFKAATKWGVFTDVYCPNEATFEFLENVLLEVFELFPSQYIHIGGDECPKEAWEKSQFCQDLIKEKGLKDEHGLQSYFITRMEKFINKHGRNIIGWDEILEGGLASNATVMSWRGIDGGIAAARQNHDVIMTPTSFCYLDYYQSNLPTEPLAIGGFLPLEKVYNYEPTPKDSLTADQEKHILGTQGNVWTEYMQTASQVEYMAFPRALALAEVNWSPKTTRNYDNFLVRLSEHFKRLDVMEVNYAKHIFDVSVQLQRNDKDALEVVLNTLSSRGKVHFTTNGETPTAEATTYEAPFALGNANQVTAIVFDNKKPLSNVLKTPFTLHKAVKRGITLSTPPHPSYNMGGKAALVNGIMGSNTRYGDGEWLGWEGNDVEMSLDLGKVTEIKTVNLRFFNSPGQWIHLPKAVKILISKDNKNFIPVGEFADFANQKERVVDVEFALPITLQYLKIEVENYGTIPKGMSGAGHSAWLFVDEIVID